MSNYDNPFDYIADREAERVDTRPARHFAYKPSTVCTVAGFFRCPDCGIPGATIRPDFLDCTCCGSDATRWR